MARLPWRWATGPDDVPAEGEALARLERIRGATVRKRYRGVGPDGSDLEVSRWPVRLTVGTADGRTLVARFGSDFAAPQVDLDAPGDLRDALLRAWLGIATAGRPPGWYGPDVQRYRAEVLRRLRDKEPTELEVVAPLLGWTARTVRRHVQSVGYRDWPAFVADCRTELG